MLVEGGQPEANFLRAEGMVAEARAAGCDIVVLPECLDAGWLHPAAAQLASAVPGPVTDRYAGWARQHAIHVVAGVTERAPSGAVYNAAVLFAPDGELLLHVRKVNVLVEAMSLYKIGNRVGAADTALGVRIGVNICADNFPTTTHLGTTLCQMGAQVILSPAAWVADPDWDDKDGNPARQMWLDGFDKMASGWGVPVLAVSNVGPITAGPWAGKRAIGASLAVGTGGEVLFEAPCGADQAGLFVVKVPCSPGFAFGS